MDMWICSAEVFEKIIGAVGKKYTPGDLDRDRLVSDLQHAWSKWLLFTRLDSDEGARARKELFGAIADSAFIFREKLLAPRGELERDDKYHYPAVSLFLGRSRFDAFVGELDGVISAANDLTDQNSHGGWVRLSRPPKEWMAAEVLPEVFERNFHKRASLSLDGPSARFVAAVMAEWHIIITRETIVRALKEVRKGLPRRKRRPTTLSPPKGW